MSDNSKIEWTDATWNPIVGCSIVSPGCTNCYAMRQADRIRRMQKDPPSSHYFGTTKIVNGNAVWTGKVELAPDRILTAPLRRRKPTTYFVNSMGDLFHESVPDEWIDRVFAVMALAPQHSFMVLTKRATRMHAKLSNDAFASDVRSALNNYPLCDNAKIVSACARVSDGPLPNVMLGVTAEDQRRADERIPHLIETPAAKRFVSIEPMLGPVDLTRIQVACDDDLDGGFLDALGGGIYIEQPMPPRLPHIPDWVARLNWVICGGESGPGARPMHPEWAMSLRDQCREATVSFFMKQMENGGKLTSEISSFPADLQIRQFPK